MTEHLSDRVTALAALTFSDWLLKGADDSICSSLTAMMQTLSEGPQTVAKAAFQAAHVLRESSIEEQSRCWTRAFCVGEGSVTPHQSVAVTGLVMQEPRDEVLQVMSDFGLAPEAALHEPADHLGVLLAFWARLLAAPGHADAAVSFAEKHLSWVPWVRAELEAKQPDNDVAMALVTLLETVIDDFLRKHVRVTA